jgi:uncharacterized protein with HEPN domain
MAEHARGVLRAVSGRTLDDYRSDEEMRLLVERRIEIIGEAAGHVSERFQNAHPEIPWRKIVAQRNILAHGYAVIDDEIMWDVAMISIPELIRLLEPIVPPAGSV